MFQWYLMMIMTRFGLVCIVVPLLQSIVKQLFPILDVCFYVCIIELCLPLSGCKYSNFCQLLSYVHSSLLFWRSRMRTVSEGFPQGEALRPLAIWSGSKHHIEWASLFLPNVRRYQQQVLSHLFEGKYVFSIPCSIRHFRFNIDLKTHSNVWNVTAHNLTPREVSTSWC